MGVIKVSLKVQRPAIVGATYWAARNMSGFMPYAAYDIPIEGRPDQLAINLLIDRAYEAEAALDPSSMIGAHAEVHDGYLTLTIGDFAT